ncbi:hypothetical protein GOODEAATRI_025888 [Goodea atripinnis]|uniref:Uncharacterized protein n=1 Tax=Goodea atripinnis TaxID=208336 RepID=A0ABV0Q128_9TELE
MEIIVRQEKCSPKKNFKESFHPHQPPVLMAQIFIFFSTSYKHFSSKTEKLSKAEDNRIMAVEREPLVENRGETTSAVWKHYEYAEHVAIVCKHLHHRVI